MRKLTEEEKRKFTCQNCSKEFKLEYRVPLSTIAKFCTLSCRDQFRSIEKSKIEKECRKCKKIKPNTEFGQWRDKGTYHLVCIECRENSPRSLNKKYQETHGMSYSTFVKGQSPKDFLRDMVKNAKKRSKYKDLEFDLTLDDMLEIYEKQNGNCALSGVKMTYFVNQDKVKTNMSFDRIDSSKGYNKDNIQIVCYYANIMKNDLNLVDFYDWCDKILKNRKS